MLAGLTYHGMQQREPVPESLYRVFSHPYEPDDDPEDCDCQNCERLRSAISAHALSIRRGTREQTITELWICSIKVDLVHGLDEPEVVKVNDPVAGLQDWARRRAARDERRERAVKLYAAGMNKAQIGRALGVCDMTVAADLRDALEGPPEPAGAALSGD